MKKILLIIFLLNIVSYSQLNIPKSEMRGVWIATVVNYDWPSSPGLSVAQQKQELVDMIERMKLYGFNTIYFQVRAEADAFYNSNYEPWSYYLTGTQGVGPNPTYDPLEFAIEEAHKRGLELHAWFNPYRAVRTVGAYSISPNHISRTHPEYIITINTFKFLNPGLPEVEDYVLNVIMDVVKRYKIDGVHMDDYFYPYPPDQISTQDTATFRLYNRGITNIGDWRRDNVNKLVAEINDSIQVNKPYLKFGMSPFGIWKPGFPPGISGMDAYNTIYCDAINWLQNQSIDYLTPQLYWAFGGATDFAALANWWSDSAYAHGRHIYPGLATYREADIYTANEIPSQLSFTRNNSKIQGTVQFRAKVPFYNNSKGITDSLKYNYFSAPSITNKMMWKDTIKPNAPTDLTSTLDPETNKYILTWTPPSTASDGDTASRYAIYRFDHSPSQAEIDEGNHLIGLAGVNSLSPKYTSYSNSPGSYFVVTALDENSNESNISNVFNYSNSPMVPQLIYPANNSAYHYDTVKVSWRKDVNDGAYQVQVAKDSLFTDLIKQLYEYKDSVLIVKGLEAQVKYYWRVKAYSLGGKSDFSPTYSFKTAFPLAPELVSPTHGSTITTVSPTLVWNKSADATSYRVQLSYGVSMTPTIKDTTVSDTSVTFYNLVVNKNHFWRVSASNQYGISVWSSVRGFKTPATSENEEEEIIKPNEYRLSQNYPNPFNPITNIKYTIKQASRVTLKLFNVLGNEVKTLVDEYKSAGQYEVQLNAENIPSGVYFYKIVAGDFTDTKKLIIMK
ncbi:MAG TPA: family 10 glycosylhydrolase [Ignavibacteriaceae bacterium]|nr:family 10 glycosylhydrolase [Ignavibacteriaceae bacterium]